ncbi:MAG: hypothetical protein ACJART_003041, partial [Maribacter sp.]
MLLGKKENAMKLKIKLARFSNLFKNSKNLRITFFSIFFLVCFLAQGQTATITATDAAAAESPLGTGTYTVSLDVPNNTGSAITINYT